MGHPRLLNRSGRYYLRAKVPVGLVPVLGRREVRRALGTGDYRQAVERLRLASAEVDAEFAEARRRAAAEPKADLSEHEARQLALLWFARAEREAAAREAACPPDDPEAFLESVASDEVWLSDAADESTVPTVQRVADALLKEQRIAPDRSGAAYISLCALIRRGMVEGLRRSRRRLGGDFSERGDDPAFSGVGAGSSLSSAPERPKRVLTLAELVEGYMGDASRAHLTAKTRDGYAIVFRALKELLGADRPIDGITRDDCRRVRDVLASLPPNATKRWPGLTLEQAAALGRERGLAPLSPTAANSYLNNLSALFNWAQREDYLDRNPARGLRLAAPLLAKRDRREPFSPEQLRAIFSAPLYTGCEDDGPGYATPGPNRPRRARFWVPLISLFSGLRLGKALQLAVEDVIEADRVPVLRVRPDPENGQRVKTAAGRRVVPVHPELVRIGLLEFAARQRTAGEARLFPEARPGPDGYLSDPFQKWFGRFLVKAGAAAPRTSFHSFRHNFRDAMREAGIPLERARALGGWTGGGTEEVYGSGLRPSTLAREVARIGYPTLDLSHLHAAGAG